jgi:hypothetical protein
MKIGTENRTKTWIAVGLAVVALLLFVRMMMSPASSGASPSAPGSTANPASTPATGTRSTTQRSRSGDNARQEKRLTAMLKPSLDPRLRFDLLKGSEDVKYAGSGRDIFSGAPEVIPTPVAKGRTDIAPPPQVPVNTGPPPPPPINVKFFGYATRGGRKSIFLSQGDTVFTAYEGDTIAGRYRILKINPTSVEIQDVLSNNTQTIPLTQG